MEWFTTEKNIEIFSQENNNNNFNYNNNNNNNNHTGIGLSSSFSLKPKDWKPPLGDSGQNSLECWDYTMELEMLKGPADLQLAAELGKTLLERNKDLENTIKEQRSAIDDKTQEIEYLSKQTAALREVNDSRLRIYEQLEISIQDLENSNQRLSSESNGDKKKIKSLTTTIDHLETKCDELEKCLDDSKALQHQQLKQQLQQEEDQNERGRTISRRLQSPEEVYLRRSMSCENPSQCCENLATECVELQMKLESLQLKLKTAQEEVKSETKKREDLEIELECASQENAVLREQILVLREKENNARSFEDELASVDDTSSSRICRKCMGLADETGSSMTMQDFTEDLEDMDTSFEALQGDCALVRLKNGGYAWGSQESLASMGQVVNSISHESSPRINNDEAPNSLLSELDTQYRILIEKYEALLEAREQRELHDKIQIQPPPAQTLIDSGIDEMSGPMSLVMTDIGAGNVQTNVSGLCQRCTKCSCDLKLPTNRPTNIEEHSEVETSSSGFSEGETRLCSKMTQTEICDLFYNKEFEEATTPTPFGNNGTHLDFQTPMNPCESRFQTAPIYRRIFHEIFEVLKKDVDKENMEEDLIKIYDSGKEYIGNMSTENLCSKNKNKTFDTGLRDENEENKNPNVIAKEEVCKKEEVQETKVELDESRHNEDSKPVRPDYLDLDSSSSRCSSRSRRRKRLHKHRNSNNQQPCTETSKGGDNSEKVSSEIVKPQNSEPPAPVNTPATVSTLPKVSSGTSKDNKTKELSCSANKKRCEHKQRKSKRQSRSQQPLQNKPVNKVLNQNTITSNSSNPRYQSNVWSQSGTITAPHNYPSVQVAKLIKFERSYAEVLKSRRS